MTPSSALKICQIETPPSSNHILFLFFGTKAVEEHFKTSGILLVKREPDQSASVLSHTEGKGKLKKIRSRAEPNGANGGSQAEAPGQAREERLLGKDSNDAKNLALRFM